MIVAPYVPGRVVDEFFERLVKGSKKQMARIDDDAVFVCFGTAGTGKTTLMMHALGFYADEPSLASVALTRKDFAQALHRLTKESKDLFVGNDEGNVSKREALTSWNRDIIDLYFAIRGKKAMHWWNNPSLDYLDRVFVEERVKFVIFCFSKGASVRKYRVFTKDSVLRMLDKEGDLRSYTFRKKGERYALYEGWFKAYTGPLWAEYLGKKEDRMDEKLIEFNAKYGLEDAQSVLTAAERLGVSNHTLKRALVWAADAGKLEKGVDYTLKGSRWLLTSSGVEKLRDFVGEKAHTKRYKDTGVQNSTLPAPRYISREGDGGPGPLGRRRRG